MCIFITISKMETSIEVRNADVKIITSPKVSAPLPFSSDVETVEFSTESDRQLVELDESATLARATEREPGRHTEHYGTFHVPNVTSAIEEELESRAENFSFRHRWETARWETARWEASAGAQQKVTQVSLKICKWDVFICGLCGRQFVFPDPIQTHMLTVHSRQKHSFKCYCDDTSYDSIDKLLLHKKKNSYNKALAKCEPCNRYFNTESQLMRHNELKIFRCIECDATFEKRNVSSEHWLHYNRSGPFKCKACTYETRSCYASKNHPSRGRLKTVQLRQHRKPPHGTHIVYKCEFCKTMFDLEKRWRWHRCPAIEKESESGDARGAAETQTETMYQCTFCKDTFALPAHLKHHMRMIHFLKIDSQMDILSCLKRDRDPVETPTLAVLESENIDKTTEHKVAINGEPQMSEETNDATASLAFPEGLTEGPREAAECEAKTEHFLFDIDDEDFEDDIIILDTDNAIQYVKEEPRTPERGDARALETVDEYLERNERLHTFSMPVERKPGAETPVVMEEAIDVLPRDGNSTVAVDQLLRVAAGEGASAATKYLR